MTPYVLVIEDELDVREMLCDVLQEFGYASVSFRDGRAALEHLRTRPAPFLILLDDRMPVMDGRQFRARQLDIPALASIPTVLLSGDDTAEGLSGTRRLHKPIDVDVLLRIVEEYHEQAPGPGR